MIISICQYCQQEYQTQLYILKHGRKYCSNRCGRLVNVNKDVVRRRNQQASRTYQCWADMKQRCSNPKVRNYKNYGGRGIKVCDRWQVFDNFLEDMGLKPEGLTLERLDVNGNYEPLNCKWATWQEQANNRNVNHFFEYHGTYKTLPQWAREFGFDKTVIESRIHKLGWTLDIALNTPVRLHQK